MERGYGKIPDSRSIFRCDVVLALHVALERLHRWCSRGWVGKITRIGFMFGGESVNLYCSIHFPSIYVYEITSNTLTLPALPLLYLLVRQASQTHPDWVGRGLKLDFACLKQHLIGAQIDLKIRPGQIFSGFRENGELI